MRFIDRNSPPLALAEWKHRETVDHQRHYDGSLPTEVKAAIRDNRVVDQGFLCAYTMQSIRQIIVGGEQGWDAHLEHVVTRKSSRERDRLEETVDYRNLVACVNRAGDLHYGASVRGDTVEDLPVNPLQSNCSERFRFRLTGKVDGVDAGAVGTIKILNLNHSYLKSLRQSRIAGSGFGISASRTPGIRRLAKPTVTATKARRIAVDVMQWRADGSLTEFCVAIAQAAEEHAKRVEHVAQRRRYARRQR